MPFQDTPTRVIVELTPERVPAGRYQLESHRVLVEDPSYARVVTTDLSAAEFAAIFDNASVALAGEVQAAHALIAALQGELTQRTTERDAARAAAAAVAQADLAWETQVRPRIEAVLSQP